jgi:PAS domain S-box-containing protein
MIGQPSQSGTKRVYLTDRMVLTGIGLGLVYWLLEALLYLFATPNFGLLGKMLPFDLGGIGARVIVLCLFLIYGSHAQFTINSRRTAEEALRKSEERYRTIIENIKDGYCELDLAGHLTFFNDALCTVLGLPREQLSGQDLRQLMPPAQSMAVGDSLDQLHRHDQSVRDLAWHVDDADGQRRYIEGSAELIREAGRVTGFRCLLRDVTRRRRAEALQRDKLAAEAASRSKSEFLANMSHEIRTPLNAIIGLTELVLATEIGAEQREDLEVARASSYALLAVINDVLDFSKIEAGKLELERIAFDLREQLGETLRILALKAHEKGLELAYRVDPDVPAVIVGDPGRLRQVIINLVGNAVKFTDSGEVIVSVDGTAASPSAVTLAFEVRDTGIGIAPEKQQTIFLPFEQSDGTTARRYGGTGLGLAVSAQLVGLMGGAIGVESAPGAGSRFHFTAHFDLPPQGAAPPALVVPTAGTRVLVVDDNATHRRILDELLRGWNLVPETAASAAEAQECVVRASAPFALALVDAEMPGADGYAVAGWLRQNAAALPVVMMMPARRSSGHGELAALGIAVGVSKPLRPSDLLEAMQQALGTRPAAAPQRAVAATVDASSFNRALSILVAEDTPFNQKFIGRLLERWGHRHRIVGNGREALLALERERFDLVLMDVQMPEMDGLAATAVIRQREADTGGRVPIIAMTAHAMRGDRERCLAAGMDGYVSKPIAIEALRDAMLAAVAEEPAPPAVPATQPEAPEALDPRSVLRAFDDDPEFLAEAVGLFLQDCPPMLAHLRAAVQAGDHDARRRTAHSLKGMLGNFGATDAVRLAFSLEQAGSEHDPAALSTVCTTLERAIDHVAQELRRLIAKEHG